MAKIAIGIPAYNEIVHCANSRKIQQFEHSDLEILISDNNSEDETVLKLKKLLRRRKPKMVVSSS